MTHHSDINRPDANSLVGWLMKALPWVAAPIIFFMVCDHFFAPQFEDKSLGQSDIVQYLGMSRDIREHREATGEDPQWTGSIFSGMPAYLIDMEHPTQDVKQTIGQSVKILDEPMGIIFFAMVLMMVAIVLMGMNPWIGIIAGLAYGLSTYFFLIIDAGHITKAWAMVYAPPLVGAVWYTLRKNMWVGGVLAALFGSLELGANHPQITYYFLLVCAALWLSEMWFTYRDKAWSSFGKRTAILAVAALLAGASNFSPLWYAASHQNHTVRGAGDDSKSDEEARQDKIDWNTEWSYGKAESFNMFVPLYMGASPLDERNIDEVDELLTSSDANAFFEERAYGYADAKMASVTPEQIHHKAIETIKSDYERQYNIALTTEYIESTITDEELDYYHNVAEQSLYNGLFHEGNKELNLPIYKAASSLYWGEQPFTVGPTYLGAVVVFLAILGIIITTGRNRWWLLAITIFAILLAWGKNMMWFYELMFDILPGYSSYRTVSMALVVVEWSVVVLAAYALMALWRSELSMRRLAISILSAAGISLLIVILMGVTTDYGMAQLDAIADTWWGAQLKDALYEARREAFMSDAWRTVTYVALAAAIMLIYVWFKNREHKNEYLTKALPYAMLLLVGSLMVHDLMKVNDRYFNEEMWKEKESVNIMPTAADSAILKDRELGYRVFDVTSIGTTRAAYFHRSVDGYHGAKLSRYNEVLKTYINDTDEKGYLKYDPEVLAMLNVKYFINGSTAKDVIESPAYGAAWFVESAKHVASAKEAFKAIGSEKLDRYAIVEPSAPELAKSYDTSGKIELVEYAPNYLKYEYDTPAEALAVFSEIYYEDGWTAYIDGEEADYFTVNYILRGMELPAGKHTVEWKFRAPNWGMATAITGIGSWTILIALLLLVTAPLSRRYLLPRIKSWYDNKREKR